MLQRGGCSCLSVHGALLMQTVNTMMYLESPYPDAGKVEVINMTAQLVDAGGRPVPLSDVRTPYPCPALTRRSQPATCRL